MREEVIFFKRKDILTHEQDQYYQDLFYRVLKIGTELEFAVPKGINAQQFRDELEPMLKASGDLENLGELGVYDCVKEHCGVEVQVIGRHPHWNALINQYKKILDILLARKVRMKPTCGLHFHLIAVGLAEPVPHIVLANLWNLIRRHAPGLKFLFSGGAVSDGICRRRQHNAHQEFMAKSPVFVTMKHIQESLRKSTIVPEHQNFFNLEHVVFNDDGTIKNFHIELRFPDGDLSATSIVAKTFLFFALLLKSVEISKYGLIHTGSKKIWDRKKELLDMLSNNDGNLARSDTSKIGPDEIAELRENATEILIFLKSIFNKFTNPAYSVLRELVNKPISFRRIEKKDWFTIEEELWSVAHYPLFIDEIDTKLIKIIELGLERDKKTRDDWLNAVSFQVKLPETEIKKRINSYFEKYPLWDAEIGSFVFSK